MLERPFRPVIRSTPPITLRYADILANRFAGKRTLRVHFGHADENAFLIGLLYERSCVDPDIGTDEDTRFPIVSVWWKRQAQSDLTPAGTMAQIAALAEAEAHSNRYMVERHLYVQAYTDLLKALDDESPMVIQDKGCLDYYFAVNDGDAVMAVCFDLELLDKKSLRLPKRS